MTTDRESHEHSGGNFAAGQETKDHEIPTPGHFSEGQESTHGADEAGHFSEGQESTHGADEAGSFAEGQTRS